MEGRKGSLDDILGASWLQDLLDQGVTVYDYRLPEDDKIQRFLVHYKLDLQDTLGGSGEIDLNEYQEMIDDLIGEPTEINDVTFAIPSMEETEDVDVEIHLDSVTDQIALNTGSLNNYTAYLPVESGSRDYVFPDGVSELPDNKDKDFSVTLDGLDSLTLKDGKLDFDFTLLYGDSSFTNPPYPPLQPGSSLTLSGFRLRDDPDPSIGKIIPNVTGSGAVTLASHGATGKASISFNGATLPKNFVLVCDLKIAGSGRGFFQLEVKPTFDAFTVSGVSNLVLTNEQIASLSDDFEWTYIIDKNGDLGPSFKAVVETGELVIDTADLFPPLDSDKPDAEGWNLKLDLSGLYIQQDTAYPPNIDPVHGLSLGSPGQPVDSGPNDLRGETLNNQPVKIDGKVTVSIPKFEGESKLTFRNFPGGIEKGSGGIYKKQITVGMDVSLFSEVTVKAEDFGLGKVDQVIDQELGDDFASFKSWLNYIHFPEWNEKDPDHGLGVALEIEKLNIVGGLGLFINAPDFGLDNVFRPLVNAKDPASGGKKENAALFFMNTDSGGHKIEGESLPDVVNITVKLGLEDPKAQERYEQDKLLTMKDVVPGDTIRLTNATARLVFDWDEMSIQPQEHENDAKGDKDDPLPTYPFTGTFPDKAKSEEGIDLSVMPTGLGLYIPQEAAREQTAEEAGKGIAETLDTRLYISLKRQSFVNEEWVDDPEDDPNAPGYNAKDPHGWRRNLRVNLPSLDFRVIYNDDVNDKSGNLFTYDPHEQKDTGEWALAGPLDLDSNPDWVREDSGNADNPFKIYTAPASSPLPEMDKAIPIGNLAPAFNEVFFGRKNGPVFMDYQVELVDITEQNEGGQSEDKGAILLYPDMLKKRIVASADLLILVPMVFQALPPDHDAADGALVVEDSVPPVVITIDPDTGNQDLFGRAGLHDKGYLDLITSFGFDVNIKNMAGLSAGKLYLQNKAPAVPQNEIPQNEIPKSEIAESETPEDETPEDESPEKPDDETRDGKFKKLIVDFSSPKNNLSLTSGDLEEIKGMIWPFIPQVSIEFERGEVLRIERNFNLELQSVTIKAGGEYTFETGL
jgi:hypothetical protein